jgi:hypothetical protein
VSEKQNRREGVKRSFDVGSRVGGSETLAELVAERNIHPLRVLSVYSFIASWGIFVDALGYEPNSVDELAEVLKIKRDRAFRWQKAFREAFPEYRTPALLWAAIDDQVNTSSGDLSVVTMTIGAAKL